uniref:Uncharacterized protein n=1 Tax=Tanacetum cinerariifolium TaxID=118510 RepID=A0A699IX34_TANCI|nr:hypothetical protein [Tanacetum cinerariifolium]
MSLTEVEHSSEKNLSEQSASNPAEASSSRVSLQQNPSFQIHATTSSEATTDSAQSDSGLRKKVRGPTRKQAIWDMVSDWIVVKSYETGQPGIKTFTAQKGHHGLFKIQFKRISVTYDSRDLGPLNFTGQPGEQIHAWGLSDMGNKLKFWRCELKKKFCNLSLTIEEIVAAQNDERVDNVEFKELVTRWFDQKTQVETETKLIRSKSNEPHVIGTKSFARITHD